MRTYYLPYKQPCEWCDGDGYVANPDWSEFHEETGGYPGLPYKKWLKKAKKWFRRRGLDRLPDEVILCRNCGGEGVIWGLAQVAGGDK